jgi:hypothetical protein
MTQQSEIVHHKHGGTTLVGPDAIELMRAATVKQGLLMHFRTKGGMRLTRMATPTLLLKLAKQYTGKTYKRKADYSHFQDAANDVQVWIDTMRAALPITDERD